MVLNFMNTTPCAAANNIIKTDDVIDARFQSCVTRLLSFFITESLLQGSLNKINNAD
jgi:hypothetical protein